MVCVCRKTNPNTKEYFLKSHQNNALSWENRTEFCKYFTNTNQPVFTYIEENKKPTSQNIRWWRCFRNLWLAAQALEHKEDLQFILQGRQQTLRGSTKYHILQDGWNSKIHILVAIDTVTEAENSIKTNSILEENYFIRMVT